MSLLIAPVMLLAVLFMPAGAVQAWAATGAGAAHGTASAQRTTSLTPTAAASPAKQAAPAHQTTRAVPASEPPVRRACPPPKRDFASCLVLARTDVRSHKGLFGPDATPSGYGPSDFQNAYALPSATAGAGETVALVDAYDDPNAESDLATYRTQYGLPACTTASGCFEKVNQNGQQGSYPSPNSGWAEEESLDVDMVSAICPNCHILLVEANSNSNADLNAAEDEAVALGAKYVSNSWASCEYSGETSDDQYFNHPGVAITAAGGDSGYDNYQQGCTTPNYPASSQYVTSVGGTRLTRDSSVSRGWTETTWSPDPAATGSGCSQYEAKPAWQADPGCANRMTNDVSADADPATGAAIYDTDGVGGWTVVGGTSEASPIIAATYALAGTPEAGTYPASYPYLNATGLNDVTSGSDYSQACTPAYFCTAGPGYDGPTGLGTPDGVSAFAPVNAGTLAGTVTDASTGKALAGATVTIGSGSVKTNSSGQYRIEVGAGTYTVTAGDYGYAKQSTSGVQVSQRQTTTVNFTLNASPFASVSGTVTDGSGHGWPIYAKITIDGYPYAPVYTNPYTGRYSVKLPEQATYTVHVTAVSYPGYLQKNLQLPVGSTATVHQDVSLAADLSACNAPGYGWDGTSADFTGWDGASAQDGWTVQGRGATWRFDNPGGRTPPPGGDAHFAIADSDYYTHGRLVTSLTSPAVNLSSQSSPVLSFDTSYYGYPKGETADVELSTNGGGTWATIWHHATGNAIGHVQIPIPQASSHSSVQVRFHYTGSDAWWWAIDNVFIGTHTCIPVSGGIVAGIVSDSSGHQVVGAAVTSNDKPDEYGVSVATPDDPNLPGGYYWLFSSLTGSHSFTASATGYTDTTATVNVASNGITRHDWQLQPNT